MEQPKPGYKTTQFWSHILIGSAIAGLTALTQYSSGLPDVPKAIVLIAGPVLLVILQKIYNGGRTEIAVAAENAKVVASNKISTEEAVKALRTVLGK